MYKIVSYMKRLLLLCVVSILVSSGMTSVVYADSGQYIWPNEEYANSQTSNADISWISRDGNKIALRASINNQGYHSWLYDVTTQSAEELDGPYSGSFVHLSDDARYLLYLKEMNVNNNIVAGLYLKDRLLSTEVRLDEDANNSNTYPVIGAPGSTSISKDGSAVLFAASNFSAVQGAPQGYNLYIYNHLNNQYSLVNDISESNVSFGVLSGNGRYVLYGVRQFPAYYYSIRLYDRLSGTRQDVGTGFNCSGNALRINGDGSVVSYSCRSGSKVINLNTTEERSITDDTTIVTSMSDDGKLFTVGRGTSYYVYSWDRNEVRPVDDSPRIGYPILSGDGNKMAWLVEVRSSPYTDYAPKTGPVPAFTVPDQVPPIVTGVPSSAPNSAGWYQGDVTVNWSAVDPEPSSGAPTQPSPTIANIEGEHTYVSDPSCDPNGNCATGSITLKIDKTIPVLSGFTWSQNPKPIAGSTTLTVEATDAGGSGVARGEYFLGDSDPGKGNGASMSWDGTNLSTSFGTDFQTGVYKVSVRAQDNAGNWSAPTSDYLVVYNPNGPRMTGKKSVVPSLANGDILPGLISASQTDAATFGFSVKYNDQGQIDPKSDLQFKYNTDKCSGNNQQNCHKLELNATSISWLIVQGNNNSTGIFQGTATMQLDGQTSTVAFRVTGVDGERLDATSLDRFQIEIFAPGADPNTATPLYKVSSTNIARGNIKLIGGETAAPPPPPPAA